MSAHNPVEITGNLIVHHPIKFTPAPAPCRNCGRVHQPVTVGQSAR